MGTVAVELTLGVDLLSVEVGRDLDGSDPNATPTSASECAGSVDVMSVRWPESAARRAVEAATVVTSLPVTRTILMLRQRR